MTAGALFEKEESELLLLPWSPHNMFLFLFPSVVVVFLFGVVFGFIIARLPEFPNKLNRQPRAQGFSREKSFRVNLDCNSDEYCKTVVT